MKKINTRNASGLVEALIVMAIIGTTLVSSMLLVAQGFVEVKNNQTEDTINGLLIQVLTKLKNSNAFEIALTEYNTIGTTEKNFYLRPNNVLKLDTSQSPSTPITTCASASVYNVVASAAVTTSITQPLCIQVTIKRLQAGSNTRFSGSINYIYQINEELVASKLIFAKYSAFNVPGLVIQGAPSGAPIVEPPFEPNPPPGGGDVTF